MHVFPLYSSNHIHLPVNETLSFAFKFDCTFVSLCFSFIAMCMWLITMFITGILWFLIPRASINLHAKTHVDGIFPIYFYCFNPLKFHYFYDDDCLYECRNAFINKYFPLFLWILVVFMMKILLWKRVVHLPMNTPCAQFLHAVYDSSS